MTYNVGLILLAIGLLVFIYGLRSSSADRITERLQVYIGGVEQEDVRSVLPRYYRRPEVTGTFRSRVLLPIFQKASHLLGRITPGRLSKGLERQLAIAGNPLGLGPREFYGIRLVFTVTGIILAILLFQADIGSSVSSISGAGIPVTGRILGLQPTEQPFSLTGVLISVLALVITSNLPRIWIRRKANSRVMGIRKALPDALDMLSVCADAGLGFDQSLQKVSTSWDNTLAKEFGRVVTEMGMGISRRVALRNLAGRTDVLELNSFVAVIIQSDQLGMSITQTLHAQAKQMRIERRFRAQELARKMPLKMLFPLILLIFPAMFAVILGPMVPVLGELFRSMGAGT